MTKNIDPFCPCCSGKAYSSCCKPLHEGHLAENALELMRARYSAYVFGLGTYIVKTTHPASAQYEEDLVSWKKNISQFSKGSTFHKLEVLDFKEHNSFATVVFTAYITQKEKNTTFTEKSHFEKVKNQWLYKGGQLVEGHAPNLVTTGESKVLPLAYYGDPILRRKADPVISITEDIKKLVEDMIETMDTCNGIGLAAPQIHHSIQLFIARMCTEKEETGFEVGEVKVFLNPTISSLSDETWEATEGCLSIPTIHASVKRPKEITVEYMDLEGNKHQERFSGWQAKVIMHENDHLLGILFIDYLEEKERAELEPFLQNLKKRIHDGTEL